MGDLKKWVNQKWVDIGAPKKDGKYQHCRSEERSVGKEGTPRRSADCEDKKKHQL